VFIDALKHHGFCILVFPSLSIEFSYVAVLVVGLSLELHVDNSPIETENCFSWKNNNFVVHK